MSQGSEVDDFLEHFGVKGMKWGRRKARVSEETSPRTKPERPEKKFSDEELRERIARLQMEKQYAQLVKETSRNPVRNGVATAETILKTAKTINDVYNLVNSPLGKIVKAAVMAKFNK